MKSFSRCFLVSWNYVVEWVLSMQFCSTEPFICSFTLVTFFGPNSKCFKFCEYLCLAFGNSKLPSSTDKECDSSADFWADHIGFMRAKKPCNLQEQYSATKGLKSYKRQQKRQHSIKGTASELRDECDHLWISWNSTSYIVVLFR